METHLEVDILAVIELKIIFIPEDRLPIHLFFYPYAVFFPNQGNFLQPQHVLLNDGQKSKRS